MNILLHLISTGKQIAIFLNVIWLKIVCSVKFNVLKVIDKIQSTFTVDTNEHSITLHYLRHRMLLIIIHYNCFLIISLMNIINVYSKFENYLIFKCPTKNQCVYLYKIILLLRAKPTPAASSIYLFKHLRKLLLCADYWHYFIIGPVAILLDIWIHYFDFHNHVLNIIFFNH